MAGRFRCTLSYWLCCAVTGVLFCIAQGPLSSQCNILKDIYPGSGSGMDGSYAGKIVANGKMYFAADDGIHGTELWCTDGTEAGTYMIKDINPGQASSTPKFFYDMGGFILFAADDGVTGIEWWRSDGTPEGTELVVDFIPGPGNGLTPLHDYFKADASIQYDSVIIFNSWGWSRLCRTNGTATGTYVLKTVNGVSPDNAREFIRFQDKIYFISNDENLSHAFMVTDGTDAGTRQVANQNRYLKGSNLHAMPTNIYYSGYTSWINDEGSEPWVSDGTNDGTRELKDIHPTSSSLTNIPGGIHKFQPTGDWVLFAANDGMNGAALWRSNGTASGTKLIKDFNPSSGTQYAPKAFNTYDDVVYFLVDDGVHGNELWRSTGESNTTYMLKDINPGPDLSMLNFQPHYHLGKFYFCATDSEHGFELWESDGTPAGTIMTMDILPDSSSYPDNFISLGNVLLFSAYTPERGYEFYRHDPTLPPFTVIDTIRQPQCFESADGEILLSISGGLPPYTIEWSDPGLSGPHLQSLSEGEYEVIVRDSFGYCTTQRFILTQPDELIALNTVSHATQQYANGSIRMNPSGGTPPYSFTWSHADSLTAGVATNLAAGVYTCTVTDAHGCYQILSSNIKQIKQLDEVPGPGSISLTPNPITDDEIVLRSQFDVEPGTVYQIYNSNGTRILSGIITTGNEENIDVRKLVPGIYYFRIVDRTGFNWGQWVVMSGDR